MSVDVPVLAIVGWSGSGKTTLLEKLLPILASMGERCAVIKHAHHDFDIDIPGKDSYRLRQAGATPMLVASSQRYALMMETPGQDEPDFDSLIDHVMQVKPTLVLVEGFKFAPLPKLEVYRQELGKALLYPDDEGIYAVASPGGLASSSRVQALNLDQPHDIASWIHDWCTSSRLGGLS